MTPEICTHYWAVESDWEFSANHYCWLDEGHDGLHRCECSAECDLEVVA